MNDHRLSVHFLLLPTPSFFTISLVLVSGHSHYITSQLALRTAFKLSAFVSFVIVHLRRRRFLRSSFHKYEKSVVKYRSFFISSKMKTRTLFHPVNLFHHLFRRLRLTPLPARLPSPSSLQPLVPPTPFPTGVRLVSAPFAPKRELGSQAGRFMRRVLSGSCVIFSF